MLDRLAADARRHRPAAADGVRRGVARSSAALGAAIALLGVTRRLGHRRRGPARARAGRGHRPRLRPLHRLPRYRRARSAIWIALALARACRLARSTAAAASQHRAVRGRVLRRRAVPETARAAAPEHAHRRRAVPRAPVSGRARRQPVLHVDRARRLSLPVSRRVCTSSRRRLPASCAASCGDMALLRIITCAVDARRGPAALLRSSRRAWGNRLAAAIAVALYHLIPLDFGDARRPAT